MTPTEQAQLHVILLQALRSKGDLGRTVEALLHDARMIGGFDAITKPQLESELKQLADKNWIAPMEFDLGLPRFRIAALGLSKLTEARL
jgi:hypothetical protein